MQYRPVTHVIFDMDGLILESESAYFRVLNSIANIYGKEYSQEVKQKILGSVERDTAKIFLKELDISITIEEFLELFHKKTAKELQNVPLMTGAEKLINHLSSHNIPIAVATSSSMESYKIKTKNHEQVFKHFHHVVCGSSDSEVKNGKPAPDIFLVCASRFEDNPDPSKCLVFEDATNGAIGALAAGMQAVLVPDEKMPLEKRKPANLVIDCLEAFKPEMFGLPPFDC